MNSHHLQGLVMRKGESGLRCVVWGTLGADKANPIFLRLCKAERAKGYDTIRYIEKDAATLEDAFARAVAYDERVPDLPFIGVIRSACIRSMLLSKVIPFGYYPLTARADYERTFIPAADVFLRRKWLYCITDVVG